MKLIVIFLFLLINSTYSLNLRNTNTQAIQNTIQSKKTEDDLLIPKLISDYTIDPENFLKTHNNTDIFITLFSNTKFKVNGKDLYDQFIKSKYNDDMQTTIDKMNNLENSNEKWSFNPLKKKFELPEDSKYIKYLLYNYII